VVRDVGAQESAVRIVVVPGEADDPLLGIAERFVKLANQRFGRRTFSRLGDNGKGGTGRDGQRGGRPRPEKFTSGRNTSGIEHYRNSFLRIGRNGGRENESMRHVSSPQAREKALPFAAPCRLARASCR